jgi:hypothetical protein
MGEAGAVDRTGGDRSTALVRAARRGVVLASVLVLAGCEEQEAVSLWASLPIAALLVAVPVALLRWAWVALDRRPAAQWPRPDGGVPARAAAVAVLALVAGLIAVLPASIVGHIAVGYRRRHEELFGMGDLVGFALIVNPVVSGIVLGLGRLARGIWFARRGAVLVALTISIGIDVSYVASVPQAGWGIWVGLVPSLILTSACLAILRAGTRSRTDDPHAAVPEHASST